MLKIAWYILIPILFMSLIFSFPNLLEMNINAVNSMENIVFQKSEKNPTKNMIENNYGTNCREAWFDSINLFHRYGKGYSQVFFLKNINCSFFYGRLIKKIIPLDIFLSKKSTILYPNNQEALFWYGESLASLFPEKAEKIFLEILSNWPEDGESWRRLAMIHEGQGRVLDAINDYSQSCLNGDPHANGCVHAGRLLEKQGEYQKAIHFYRLSKWQPSLDEANRLESQLASGDLTP